MTETLYNHLHCAAARIRLYGVTLGRDVEFWCVTLLWILHFVLLSAPYPLNYDSVNLARAIEDGIDISIHQPQPPGFPFQVLLGSLLHRCIANPFTVLEVQSLVYLFALLLILRTVPRRRFGGLLLCASTPLMLFFTGAPVMQSAVLPFAAAIAVLVLKTVQLERRHPVALAGLLAVGAGFRYDLVIVLGPVVLFALIISKTSIRQWVYAAVVFALITLSWYIPVSIASGGVSPLRMTIQMQQMFTSGISVVRGGLMTENIRCALRFLLYAPGVFGVGGLVCWVLVLKKKHDAVLPVMLWAVVPFVMIGMLLYMPLPHYYAPVAGFVMTLILLTGAVPRHRAVVTLCIAGNLLLFWLLPQPLHTTGTYKERSRVTNIRKQLSYMGANSAAVLLYNKELMTVTDSVCGSCERVYAPLLWDRMWLYLAQKKWDNRIVYHEDSADCVVIPVEAMTMPNRSYCNDVVIERRHGTGCGVSPPVHLP